MEDINKQTKLSMSIKEPAVQTKISYEDISSDLENDPSMVYYIDSDDLDTDYVISKFLTELKYILDVILSALK